MASGNVHAFHILRKGCEMCSWPVKGLRWPVMDNSMSYPSWRTLVAIHSLLSTEGFVGLSGTRTLNLDASSRKVQHLLLLHHRAPVRGEYKVKNWWEMFPNVSAWELHYIVLASLLYLESIWAYRMGFGGAWSRNSAHSSPWIVRLPLLLLTITMGLDEESDLHFNFLWQDCDSSLLSRMSSIQSSCISCLNVAVLTSK